MIILKFIVSPLFYIEESIGNPRCMHSLYAPLLYDNKSGIGLFGDTISDKSRFSYKC